MTCFQTPRHRPAVAHSAALTFAAAVCACTLSVSSPSAAQTPPAKTTDAKASEAKPMTRDELRACLNRSDAIAVKQAEIEREKASITQESDELGRVAKQLNADYEYTTSGDTAKREQIKAKSEANNARIQALNNRVRVSNDIIEALRTEASAYNKECGSRGFLTADKEALDKERATKKAQ